MSFNILLELSVSEGQEQKDFPKFKKYSEKVATNWSSPDVNESLEWKRKSYYIHCPAEVIGVT